MHDSNSGYCNSVQAFTNTATKILQKIQEGVFDMSNEVSQLLMLRCIIHVVNDCPLCDQFLY